MTAQHGICAWCSRPFRGGSVPRWAFDRAANPLGLMHTMCAKAANPYRWGTEASLATQEEAQFIAWTGLVEPTDPKSTRELAIIMVWAEHPSLEPGGVSANQQRWLERYPADQQAEIRVAYDQLVREFLEWRQQRHGAVATS